MLINFSLPLSSNSCNYALKVIISLFTWSK